MARYEEDDYGDEERVMLRTPEGRPAVLPKSASRLSGAALEGYAALMGLGVKVAQLEDSIGESVHELRSLGVSWNLIGVAVGLTGEGARQRYGSES